MSYIAIEAKLYTLCNTLYHKYQPLRPWDPEHMKATVVNWCEAEEY